MFGMGGKSHQEINAQDLAAMLAAVTPRTRLVFLASPANPGHVPGAVNLPLSAFNPDAVPSLDGKQVVLNCLGGKRSGMALDKCAAAQAAIDTHLAGGFNAWAEAGLPVEN